MSHTTPSRRTVLHSTAVSLGGAVLAGCSTAQSGDQPTPSQTTTVPSPSHSAAGIGPAPVTMAGLRCLARAEGTQLRLHAEAGDLVFWTGARLSGFLPGSRVGELDATAAHYRRWYRGMRSFGVRFVHLDRLHPGAAYIELAAYNQAHPTSPLYLVQGVTLPGREDTDLFEDETAPMQAAIRRAVDAVRGRADGYRTDVTTWLAAWTLDLAWSPERVAAADEAHSDADSRSGTYVISGEEATPTQHWCAARLDELAALLADLEISVPLAVVYRPGIVSMEAVVEFPIAGEDDAERGGPAAGDEPMPEEPDEAAEGRNTSQPSQIRATPAWPGGVFSYADAPPYLPDYAAADPAYASAADPYLAYLTDRAESDGTPVIVGSYTVTSALGSGYPGSGERSQGNHDEAGKFAIESRLATTLAERGFSGAVLANWLDDWSETTWNTQIRADFADRAAGPIIDHDPLTADQWGGVVAVESRRRGERVVHEAPGNELRRVLMDADASWMYLTLEFAARVTSPVEIGLDMLAGGGLRLPGGSGEPVHDIAVRTVPTMSTTYLFVRGVLDPLRIDGVPMPAIPAGNNRGWHLQRLLQSTTTGNDETRTTSLTFLDVGNLRLGDWDPRADDFDARATWHLARESADTPARLRYRLPWGLVNMLDAPDRRALTFTRTRPALVVARAMTVTIESSTPGSPISFTVSLPTWDSARYAERVKDDAGVLGSALRGLDQRIEPRSEQTPTTTPTTAGSTASTR